jgi:hypothetical protein
MRSFVILVSISVVAAACGSDAVTAPVLQIPTSLPQLPPPPELTLTIPSVTVLRAENQWRYRPQVLITETSGRGGARVIAWAAGPADGPPLSFDSPEGWCGDPRLVIDPSVANLPLSVAPGGTLDLSDALGPANCSVTMWSTDPESSVKVAVRLRDDQGRNIEAAASVVVP